MAHHLVILVTFSCKHYNITLSSIFYTIFYSFFSIRNNNIFSIGFINSDFYVFDYIQWIFKPWIVACDYR